MRNKFHLVAKRCSEPEPKTPQPLIKQIKIEITAKQAEYIKMKIEEALKHQKGKNIELLISEIDIQVVSNGIAFL
jgi:hypothetical protein